MQKLDGILQRHDVFVGPGVDLIEDRRHRRGLAAAGDAGDQDHAPLRLRDSLQHLGEVELVD